MNLRTDRAIVFPDSASAEYEDIHVVEKGETIGGIARNYGVKVRELRKANLGLIYSRTIHAGQRILIPESSTKTETIFQRDVSAFALQYRAKTKANALNQLRSYGQSYLRELVGQYTELNLPLLIETDEIEGT